MLRFITALLLLSCCIGVSAERVKDLYRFTTLVSGQGSREYNQALDDGLAEVIVRASGNPQVLQEPGILKALGSASRFLLQQNYEASDQMIEIEGKQVPASRLVLEYSAEAIEKLLRELQLSLWPNNRRNVLVWMVADDNQGRRVVSELNFAEAQKALKDNAKRRGLPLLVPVMDLEDQIALTPNQLWSMSLDDIRKASERYSPDTILAGRLSQTSRGDWRSDWQLFSDEKLEVFDSQGANIEDAIADGVDQVVDHFYQLYAINLQQGAAQDVILLQVGGIADFSQYKNVLDYLEQLTVVRRADLVAVRDDNLLLYLYTDGNVKLLQDTLKLDARLSPRNLPGSGSNNLSPLGSTENPLLYAWLP